MVRVHRRLQSYQNKDPAEILQNRHHPKSGIQARFSSRKHCAISGRRKVLEVEHGLGTVTRKVFLLLALAPSTFLSEISFLYSLWSPVILYIWKIGNFSQDIKIARDFGKGLPRLDVRRSLLQ